MPVRRETLQRFGNADLATREHLLPSMALQLSPQMFTVSMQQILGSYSLVELIGVIVFSRCHFTTFYT